MDDKIENEKWSELDIRIRSIELAIQYSIGNLDEDAMLNLSEKIYKMLTNQKKGK